MKIILALALLALLAPLPHSAVKPVHYVTDAEVAAIVTTSYVSDRCWAPQYYAVCGDNLGNCAESNFPFACGFLFPSGDCCNAIVAEDTLMEAVKAGQAFITVPGKTCGNDKETLLTFSIENLKARSSKVK